MSNSLTAAVACIVVCVAVLFSARIGYSLAQRRIKRLGDEASTGIGAADGAVFALLGLLLAFCFSQAYSRLTARREMIVREANAIGTAYLRLDLLPADSQADIRAQFREYIRTRLELWDHIGDRVAIPGILSKQSTQQGDIWKSALRATEKDHAARMLLIPALNEMIDVTTIRLALARSHPPPVIFGLLVALTILCGGLIGSGMGKSRHIPWAHVLTFAVVSSMTIFVIIDAEYPQYGFITLDRAHELLRAVEQSMNP